MSLESGISSQIQLSLLIAVFFRTFSITTLDQIRKPSVLEMTAALNKYLCCTFFPEKVLCWIENDTKYCFLHTQHKGHRCKHLCVLLKDSFVVASL